MLMLCLSSRTKWSITSNYWHITNSRRLNKLPGVYLQPPVSDYLMECKTCVYNPFISMPWSIMGWISTWSQWINNAARKKNYKKYSLITNCDDIIQLMKTDVDIWLATVIKTIKSSVQSIAWMSYFIYMKMWDIITHPCINFKCGLSKPFVYLNHI